MINQTDAAPDYNPSMCGFKPDPPLVGWHCTLEPGHPGAHVLDREKLTVESVTEESKRLRNMSVDLWAHKDATGRDGSIQFSRDYIQRLADMLADVAAALARLQEALVQKERDYVTEIKRTIAAEAERDALQAKASALLEAIEDAPDLMNVSTGMDNAIDALRALVRKARESK